MLFTAFSWLLDISIPILVFLSLGSVGTEISMSAIVIAYSITGAIQYLPIGVIPGEVGLAEIVMTTLFALLGSPQFIALFAVATVLIRCLTFWIKLLIGGIVVQLLGIKSLMPSQTPQSQNAKLTKTYYSKPISPNTQPSCLFWLALQNGLLVGPVGFEPTTFTRKQRWAVPTGFS
jgi:hypothetical protein